MDERFGVERQTFPPRAAPLLDAERDVPVFKLFQTVVGEGNPIDVGSEVGEDLRAGASRLAVGHPVHVPELGGHERGEAGRSPGRLAWTTATGGARSDGHTPGRTAEREPLPALW